MTRRLWPLVALGAALWAGAALAGYEDQLIEWGLAQHGREREPFPEGKRIEEILVSSEDIVARTDPYPQLLNIVHARTRQSVILRELLFQAGDLYQQERIEETERNLRKLTVLAIARVVPVKGREPGGVGIVVVTKDLWSIRLNSEFNFASSLLQYLRIRPTEQNFLGLNKQLSVDFALRLDTVSLGQVYTDRRLLGSPLTFSESAALIFNREGFRLEGSRGEVIFGKPLLTLSTEHSYYLVGRWLVQRSRVFRGASVWQLPYPDAAAPTAQIPFVYDARSFAGVARYTRSLGLRYKTDFSADLGGYSRRYGAPAESALDDEQSAWFTSRYLPRSEDAVYVQATARAYEARYQVLHDMQTFALSEDYQLGYSGVVSARWADPIFFSPVRFVELGVAASYRWLVGDDLLTVASAAAARHVPGATGSGVEGPWVNRRYAMEVHNLSPILGVGRVMFRALADLKFDDLDHRPVLLGGGNGLRGTVAEQLSGNHMLLFNLEYRTRPWELKTLHVGLVAFADAGSAFVTRPSLVYTVGVGLRALFPQFDVDPMRIDFGWVINAPGPDWPSRFSASFGQVEDYRPDFLKTPL